MSIFPICGTCKRTYVNLTQGCQRCNAHCTVSGETGAAQPETTSCPTTEPVALPDPVVDRFRLPQPAKPGAYMVPAVLRPEDLPLITTPEKDCPHCGRSLVNEHEFCGCPGSVANRRPVQPVRPPVRVPVGAIECPITTPEKNCPHCGRSLVNAYEECGCPGSSAK